VTPIVPPKRKKRQLVTFSWIDNGLIGNPKVLCACGATVIELEGGASISEDDVLECPKCGLKGRFKIHQRIIFEVIKRSGKNEG